VKSFSLSQKLAAEALGTCLLVAAVVGSGIMAAKLSQGNGAIALLCNTIATGAILAVLIIMLGGISGAHFNPAVTLAFLIRKDISAIIAFTYVAAQLLGGIGGTLAAHLMFGQEVFQFSEKLREGPEQWFSEFVAAFGLLLTIFGTIRFQAEAVPFTVGLYITSAYWFTASTSFANPAVTVARALSNTFAGIRPLDAPAFIAAQILGAICATFLAAWLFQPRMLQSIEAQPSALETSRAAE
jgi:glycerol uptake facilitator-like aquaporin